MKEVDYIGVTASVPPAATNGVHHAPKKKSASKRTAKSRSKAAGRELQPVAAEFAVLETRPADAPMWPQHAVLWLQPERPPSAPEWTGLAVERHPRSPRGQFAPLEAGPLDRAAAPDNAREPLAPSPPRELPQSDLTPLGWEPRAICRKEESQ